MSVKEKLQIILVTYNRAPQLQRTLDQLLAEDSPVKDFDITILDNHSTDSTPDVIKAAQVQHPNIKHVRHRHNVGGNANIAKALEMGEREYLWILCDDDMYDWIGWPHVEDLINRGEKLICVCDFDLPDGHRADPAYQIYQTAFLPSNIYHTETITDDALRNIFDTSVFLFQQLVPIIMHLNAGGRIAVADHGIVHVGPCDAHPSGNTLLRGNTESKIFCRSRTMSIPIGFANMCMNIKNRTVAQKAFLLCLNRTYKNHPRFNLLKELFLYQGGKANAMHAIDLQMAAPFMLGIMIRCVHALSCTPLRKFLLGSALHRAIQRRLARKQA